MITLHTKVGGPVEELLEAIEDLIEDLNNEL
jgi:hypothetical protein